MPENTIMELYTANPTKAIPSKNVNNKKSCPVGTHLINGTSSCCPNDGAYSLYIINGVHQCIPKNKSAVPQGSWSKTCVNPNMDQNILYANCKGGPNSATYVNTEWCKPNSIYNYNSTLTCKPNINTIPNCSDAIIQGNKLSAKCYTPVGKVAASLNLSNCAPGSIKEYDGKLMCKTAPIPKSKAKKAKSASPKQAKVVGKKPLGPISQKPLGPMSQKPLGPMSQRPLQPISQKPKVMSSKQPAKGKKQEMHSAKPSVQSKKPIPKPSIATTMPPLPSLSGQILLSSIVPSEKPIPRPSVETTMPPSPSLSGQILLSSIVPSKKPIPRPSVETTMPPSPSLSGQILLSSIVPSVKPQATMPSPLLPGQVLPSFQPETVVKASMAPSLLPSSPSLSGQILLSSIIPSAIPQPSVVPIQLTNAQSQVLLSAPVAENCPTLNNVKIISSSSSTISGTFTLSSKNWTSSQGQYNYNSNSADLNPWTNFVVTTKDSINFNFTLVPPNNKYFIFPMDLYVKVQAMYIVNGNPVESSQCITASYPVLNVISTATMTPSPSVPAFSISPSSGPYCPNITSIVLSSAMSSSINGYFTLSSNSSNLWISTQGLYTYTTNSTNQPWASFTASSNDLTKFNFTLTPMSGSFFTFPLNLSLKAQVINFVSGNPVNSTQCYTNIFNLNDVYPIISSSKSPSMSPFSTNTVSYSPSSPSMVSYSPSMTSPPSASRSPSPYSPSPSPYSPSMMSSLSPSMMSSVSPSMMSSVSPSMISSPSPSMMSSVSPSMISSPSPSMMISPSPSPYSPSMMISPSPSPSMMSSPSPSMMISPSPSPYSPSPSMISSVSPYSPSPSMINSPSPSATRSPSPYSPSPSAIVSYSPSPYSPSPSNTNSPSPSPYSPSPSMISSPSPSPYSPSTYSPSPSTINSPSPYSPSPSTTNSPSPTTTVSYSPSPYSPSPYSPSPSRYSPSPSAYSPSPSTAVSYSPSPMTTQSPSPYSASPSPSSTSSPSPSPYSPSPSSTSSPSPSPYSPSPFSPSPSPNAVSYSPSPYSPSPSSTSSLSPSPYSPSPNAVSYSPSPYSPSPFSPSPSTINSPSPSAYSPSPSTTVSYTPSPYSPSPFSPSPSPYSPSPSATRSPSPSPSSPSPSPVSVPTVTITYATGTSTMIWGTYTLSSSTGWTTNNGTYSTAGANGAFSSLAYCSNGNFLANGTFFGTINLSIKINLLSSTQSGTSNASNTQTFSIQADQAKLSTPISGTYFCLDQGQWTTSNYGKGVCQDDNLWQTFYMGSTGLTGPIENLQNSLCLGVTGSKSTYGYPLVWQGCSGTTAQQFSLIPGATAGTSLIKLPLSSTGNTAYCIDVGNAQINYNCDTTNSNQIFYTPNFKFSNKSTMQCDDSFSQVIMTLDGSGNTFNDVIVKYGRWDNTTCAGTGVSSTTTPKYVWSKYPGCKDKNYCPLPLPADPYINVYKQYQIFSNCSGGTPSYHIYVIKTFTSNGTLKVLNYANNVNVYYLIVGGGGSGGNRYYGGGGGGGGVLYNDYGSSFELKKGYEYTVTIGSGGTESLGAPADGADSKITNDSLGVSLVAKGGGKGGGAKDNTSVNPGGSSGGTQIGSSAITGAYSGNNTGNRSIDGRWRGGGGGGAGGAANAQLGGSGKQWWFNNQKYGPGGSAAVQDCSQDGNDGVDGGGGGACNQSSKRDPIAPTQYGGGGGGRAKETGGSINGKQGIVIIAYPSTVANLTFT